MESNTPGFYCIQHDLAHSHLVSHCSELADASVSAASRCLKKLSRSKVVTARKEGHTVCYRLVNKDFTSLIVRRLEGGSA